VLLVFAVVLATGCGSRDEPAAPESFASFVAGIRMARWDDYVGRSGTVVASEATFEEMRTYLLDRYEHATSERSFQQGDAVFDCLRRDDTSPATVGACPDGTVPVRRTTLAQLVTFTNLRAFLSRSPG
jgi:hypothetical protein